METDSDEFGQEDSEGRIMQDKVQDLIVSQDTDLAPLDADGTWRSAPIIEEQANFAKLCA